MGNRKQPFGYKMSQGEIVIQESEAKLVQGIFRRYIAGESLNELTEALRQQDIPYDEGRLWNKNMVARILADTRYTGEKGYVYNAFYQVMMPQYGADPAECYEARFYSYGLFGFLDEWIKRGFYETPEQITELFRKMMERRGYAENGSRCI